MILLFLLHRHYSQATTMVVSYQIKKTLDKESSTKLMLQNRYDMPWSWTKVA